MKEETKLTCNTLFSDVTCVYKSDSISDLAVISMINV